MSVLKVLPLLLIISISDCREQRGLGFLKVDRQVRRNGGGGGQFMIIVIIIRDPQN